MKVKSACARVLALLLVLCMVVGLLPLFASAEGTAAEQTEATAATDTATDEYGIMTTAVNTDPIYILAGGDFQEAGDHANSAANVTNILAQIGYTTMDGFLFIGDYDCETHNDATETANGITALMNAVQAKYSTITDANSVLVQGNHDYMDSRIDATGGHDFTGYAVYVLNEDDYPNGGGSQSGVQTLANNLKTWLNNKIGEGYEAPIFITSHLPLAFTPRTVTQGDAKYAKYIFDVLNDAAANGLNIIFMHGHDHAYGPDNYMGGEAIYLAEGDKIYIAEAGSTSAWTTETLNFTYMNAGYTGYYSDAYTYNTTDGTDKLTMTVFKIESNQVTVERYSANGLYNLKSAGRDGSYSDTSVTASSLGLTFNETVYTSPQTIALADSVDYGATIGEYVGVEAETPADDVTASGGSWVEITAPVPGNSGNNDVTTSGGSWVEITAPVPGTTTGGTTTYNYTWDTNGKDNDTAYLIVNGSSTTVLENNGTSGVTTATITSNNGTTATASTQDYEWKIDSSNRIYTTINGTTYYLNRNFRGNLELSTSSNVTEWTISNNNGEYTISYFAGIGSWGTRNYLTTSGLSTDSGTVRLYYADGSTTTGGTTTEDQNGLYGYVSGNLTYNFPTGTDADTAMAAVKAGIEVRYLEAMSTPGANATYQVADAGIITWTLDPNYDPNTPGDYAVTISYNGVTLGTAEVVLSSNDTNGTFAKIEGTLSYNLAAGTSADDVLATVKAGIDGYTYEGMDTTSAGDGTKLDDSALTWTLDSGYDPNTPGDYAVTISYGDVTLGTAEVVVPASKTYYVAEGNGLYLVDMNTSADNAMAAVKAGITVYSATDANGANKTAIDDSLVTWNWVDTYNGADSGPYTVEILYNGTSLGTVEVKVNIKYETGITDGWTSVGTTTGGYKYVLDTDGIDYYDANDATTQYIIVAADAAYAVNGSGGAAAVEISSDESTVTTTTRDYEYHFIRTTYNNTRYELITKGDGSQYLYQENSGLHYGTRSSVKFQINHHGNGVYDIHDIDGTNWYIIYNSGWTVVEDTSARVRLYRYDGQIVGGEQFAHIEGNTVYTVEQGTSATQAMAAVKEGITGYISSSSDGSNATELKDSELTWKWKNTYTSMVTGSYWVEISYNGVVLGTVEVKVEPGVVNNYPEYPDEGAVKVNKTATGIDFQSSGVAQVEVSASGVPIKKGVDVIIMLDTSSSMAYCLNCTDTRHSTYECDQGGQTRAQALTATLEDLIAQFKTPGDDGQLLDIDVAIADFNGFYGDSHSESGTPYDRDAADMMSDDISYTANSQAKIYTGDGTLGAGAFLNAEDLAASYSLNYTSGTNYDYAFDAIYQMATAKKIANGSEERELFVIFMSDGAGMQWNYYHSQGNSSLWNNWITGAWTAADLTAENLNCVEHAYYYDEDDHDGDGMYNEHRMANAIKGDPSENFEVIRKTNDLGIATGEANMYMVPGLGAQLFSIAFDPRVDTNVTVASITKSISSLASDQTGTTQYFYDVSSADALANAFSAIGNEIAYAASNARFVDQMGDNYNLQMTPIVDMQGNPITDDDGNAMLPSIEIISYDIYTKAEADAVPEGTAGDTVTEAMIGTRKGTYTVLETVTFESEKDADGNYLVTAAYSNQIYNTDTNGNKVYTNILADGTQDGYVKGVIYAKTFIYNTNVSAVAVDGVNIPTGVNSDGTTSGSTNELPSETFYWKMGTVQSSELAMRYYVYLEGSMEGTKNAGSYATNEFATLYYDNYLGNPCYKDTVSPVMAWKEANVSYAFYLVDDNGNIVVNQTTGQTGSFANKIAVTNPVVHKTILLNNITEVESIDVASLGVLPEGYELYDTGAVYTVSINSNQTGYWTIEKAVNPATTYVTQFDPGDASGYSNALSENSEVYDYTHTVVWFAVVWNIQALPDTVVIDYGLPVDISVLTNDMFGENGKLAAVGPYTDGIESTDPAADLPSGFDTSYTGNFGVATANTGTDKVRYTLNTMAMDSYEKFAYAVNYTGTVNPGYYYDTVTVIPATTVYYEDSFLTFNRYNNTTKEVEGKWEDEGTAVEGATQAEDRPGKYSLTDANHIYGYDGTYANMTMHSLGTAKKVHVDANSYGTVEFTFTGTGFDIISMTSNTTGVLAVKVTAAEAMTVGDKTYNAGDTVKTTIVNTYYGYDYGLYNVTYEWDGTEWDKTVGEKATTAEAPAVKKDNPAVGDKVTGVEYAWVATPDVDNSLYQVPVIKMSELPYGKYKVLLTATYGEFYDKTTADGYDLYVDAIRIYDPANDGAGNQVIQDAYVADGEGWPVYNEVRDLLISQETLGNATTITVINGIVFIDGDSQVEDLQITDYQNYGPNNEVYLAPGQRIAFVLNATGGPTGYEVASVQIGVKSADGNTGTWTIGNIAQADSSDGKVKAGDYYNAITRKVTTATDMYYDITDHDGDIVFITNTGNREENNTTGVISITNVKFTFKPAQTTRTTSGTQTANTGDVSTGASVMSLRNTGTETASVSLMSTVTLTDTETVTYDPPTAEDVAGMIYMTVDAAAITVNALNAMEDEAEEETVPEETVPETTVPEETVPETTVPEETVPETTVPEETVPETTVPEETVPETTVPETTVPDETVPEEPETFEPELLRVTVNKKQVKQGGTVLVTVITGTDVDALSVNGEAVEKYLESSWLKVRMWVVAVEADEVGDMEISVVAYDGSGTPAAPAAVTVKVKQNNGGRQNRYMHELAAYSMIIS